MATIVIGVVLGLSWLAMFVIYQNKKRREKRKGGKVSLSRKESKEKLSGMSPREKWLEKKVGKSADDTLSSLSPREKWLAAKTGQRPVRDLKDVLALAKARDLKDVVAKAKAAQAAQAGGGEANLEDLNVIVEAEESEAVPLMPVQRPSMQLVEQSSEEAVEADRTEPMHVPSKRPGQATLEARLSQQSALLSVNSKEGRRPMHVPSSMQPDQATIEERLSRARSAARLASPESVRPTSAPTSPPPLEMQNGGDGGDDHGDGGARDECADAAKTLSI